MSRECFCSQFQYLAQWRGAKRSRMEPEIFESFPSQIDFFRVVYTLIESVC